MPPHPAIFVRKEIFESIGKFRTDFKIAADFEWMIRAVLIHRLNWRVINLTCVLMRLGGASTSGPRSWIVSTREMHDALSLNGIKSYYLMLLARLPVKLIVQKIQLGIANR